MLSNPQLRLPGAAQLGQADDAQVHRTACYWHTHVRRMNRKFSSTEKLIPMQITFRCDPALIDVLPHPVLARQALPDWLRTMPATARSNAHEQPIRTVKQCPPFVDAMSYGFMLRLPCEIRVERGVFAWDWDLPPLSVEGHPRSPLSFHAPAQVTGTPLHCSERAIVKFNSFWTIEVEAGWSLYATHPVNRDDLPFRLITGLVDADHFYDAGINFPALWIDPDFTGVLPKGTPVAQCFAVSRQPLSLNVVAMAPDRAASYAATVAAALATPGVYRKQYRARRSRLPQSIDVNQSVK